MSNYSGLGFKSKLKER